VLVDMGVAMSNLIAKVCEKCEVKKTLNRFFLSPKDAAASWFGSSRYCIDCHDAGLIEHGYGYYGDMYRKPDWNNK